MLVIASDLHLTDGTCGHTINPGAAGIFADRLRELAQRASWRADGRYQPIEGIDLVLLGDVLDLTRSARWVESNVRPWDDPHSPAMHETLCEIVAGILQHNAEALAELRALSTDGGVLVPAGDSRGQPIFGTEGHIVPVRTHYMVGNHDWQLHLCGQGFDAIRQEIAQHLGLATPWDSPFPHDPQECELLMSAQRRHRVLARHGDIFDPLNFEGDRDESSLGDVLVVQLLSRFGLEVQRQLGDELPAGVLSAMSEVDNIRPLLLAPVWMDGMLERSCPSPATRKKVKRIWDNLADELLALPIVRQRDSWSPFDLIDGLAGALKFSQRISLGWASRTAKWLNSLRGGSNSSYSTHALAEQDFRNRRARHIIYGHTHETECVPLDASYADNFVLNQMYFNAGTWRRVYRPTQWSAGEHEFIPTEMLSYLAFFQGDERQGRPFESWSGMLGVPGIEGSTYRLDAGRQNAPPAHAAAEMHMSGPHFGAAARRTNSSRWVG